MTRNAAILVCLWLFSTKAMASFLITGGESVISQDQITHRTSQDLTISDDVITAIHKGIEIRLIYDFRLLRVRPVIWDEEIAQWQFAFRIKYHGLSASYILFNEHTNQLDTFDGIRDVLDELSRFSVSLPIVADTLPETRYGFRMAFRVQLDKESLPPPLKLIVEISPTWDLSSSWTQWPVTE